MLNQLAQFKKGAPIASLWSGQVHVCRTPEELVWGKKVTSASCNWLSPNPTLCCPYQEQKLHSKGSCHSTFTSTQLYMLQKARTELQEFPISMEALKWTLEVIFSTLEKTGSKH